jgi:HSP20 family protein
VQLGADVRAEEAKAVYEDGLLRVELPLAQPETRRHSVPIEVLQPDAGPDVDPADDAARG